MVGDVVAPCDAVQRDDAAGFQLSSVKGVEYEYGIVETNFLVLNYYPLIDIEGEWYRRTFEAISSSLVIKAPDFELSTSFEGATNVTQYVPCGYVEPNPADVDQETRKIRALAGSGILCTHDNVTK